MEKRRKRKPDRTRIPAKTFKFAEMIGEQTETQLRKVIR